MTPNQGGRLHFSGACSLAGVEAHRQDLLRALDADGPLVLDLSEVDRVDVSFVQLLVSAARTVAKRNGSIAVVNVPDAVAASFRAAGIDVGHLVPTASGH